MGRTKGALNKKTLEKQATGKTENNGQLKITAPAAEAPKSEIPKIPEAPKSEPKTDIDPNLFSEEIPDAPKDPLTEPVDKKPHTQIHTTFDPNADKKNGGGSKSGDGKAPDKPMTEAEKKTAADTTVMLMMRGYEKLHQFGRWYGKQDKTDVTQKSIEAGVDLLAQTLPVPNKDTGADSSSLSTLIDKYNADIDENIIVDSTFKSDIIPPLTRVCLKHEIFVSDEATVISLLVEDLATKASVLWGMKKTMNMMLSLVQKDILDKKNPPQQSASPKQEAAQQSAPPSDTNAQKKNDGITDAEILEETPNSSPAHNEDNWGKS